MTGSNDIRIDRATGADAGAMLALMERAHLPTDRGTGLGGRLTAAAIEEAQRLQLPALYLLTTTAEEFFPRFGFERITSHEVPDSVKQSIEFREACCASAVVMLKRLPVSQ